MFAFFPVAAFPIALNVHDLQRQLPQSVSMLPSAAWAVALPQAIIHYAKPATSVLELSYADKQYGSCSTCACTFGQASSLGCESWPAKSCIFKLSATVTIRSCLCMFISEPFLADFAEVHMHPMVCGM